MVVFKFNQILARTGNDVAVSILMALAWIASVDGEVSSSEREILMGLTGNTVTRDDAVLLVELASRNDLDSIAKALGILNRGLRADRRHSFLQLCVDIAIADGALKPAENYALRLVAQVVGVDEPNFGELFSAHTGRRLPEPSDLSSAKFWSERQSQSGSSRKSTGGSGQSSQDVEALATLGLLPGASQDEIRVAYRRLARIHHPDRFSSKGEAAARAATITFQRIQVAYNRLNGHA